MSGNPTPTADFDWANDESIICREQSAVAVYPNTRGAVVIRSERAWDEDSDVFIIVQADHAQQLADAILQAAADAREATSDPTERATTNKPKRTTAAVATTARGGGKHKTAPTPQLPLATAATNGTAKPNGTANA